MKRFLTLFIILFSLTGTSQAIQLSEFSQISILTVGPGDTSIDCYGHSAIRVKDPILRIDYVYNYGIFDFETPNFYGKFAQGKLLYKLGYSSFNNFLLYYKRQNRYIKEQILNLSNSERQQYFEFLLNNAKPENRDYLYDFFYDNCATKLRDVSQNVLKNKVDFTYSFTEGKDETLRDLIHNYSYTQPWGTLGIDIALGAVIDRKAKPEEYAFLPDYVFQIFKDSKIDGKPLVKKTVTLFDAKPKKINVLLTPFLVLSLVALLVIYLTYRDHKRKKRTKVLDALLLLSTGIIGILVLLLWLATDHSATAKNFNFLWAFPLNCIVVFLLRKQNAWLQKYFLLLIALLGITILLWVFGVQAFNFALIPIFLMLGIRYFYLSKYFK